MMSNQTNSDSSALHLLKTRTQCAQYHYWAAIVVAEPVYEYVELITLIKYNYEYL